MQNENEIARETYTPVLTSLSEVITINAEKRLTKNT